MLNELAERIHTTATEKGWWDEGNLRTFGDLIVLCHCELSEAVEEYRKGKGFNETYYTHGENRELSTPRKPEGIPIELADVLIRIFDLCAWYDIDIDKAVEEKCVYNDTRDHRHGGKAI